MQYPWYLILKQLRNFLYFSQSKGNCPKSHNSTDSRKDRWLYLLGIAACRTSKVSIGLVAEPLSGSHPSCLVLSSEWEPEAITLPLLASTQLPMLHIFPSFYQRQPLFPLHMKWSSSALMTVLIKVAHKQDFWPKEDWRNLAWELQLSLCPWKQKWPLFGAAVLMFSPLPD